MIETLSQVPVLVHFFVALVALEGLKQGTKRFWKRFFSSDEELSKKQVEDIHRELTAIKSFLLVIAERVGIPATSLKELVQ